MLQPALRTARLPLGCLAAALLSAGAAAAESLPDAWDAALAADHGLKSTREQTAAAAEAVGVAKSARWPQLSVEAGRTALAETPAIQTDLIGQPLQLPVAERYSTAYQAMATLPLFSGGRVGHGVDAATTSLDAARLAEAASIQDLRLRVAEAYVGVLRTERLTTLAGRHTDSLEAHARDVVNFHEQGLVARGDLLSAQVALADARQKALQATHALDLARAAYNRLLGRPLSGEVNVADMPFDPPLQETLETLTGRAVAGRSELAALTRQTAALRSQAAAVRGENLPQIALSGGYVYQENRYQVHEAQWMATLGARWSLFDGGSARHRAAAVERQAAALSEWQAELASLIGLQVRQAWLEVEEAGERLRVTGSAVTQSGENLRIARDRYARGLSTHTEVLDAEALRAGSEVNHAAARYDAILARLRLRRATGEL